jgi:hypothetical protein
MPASVLPITCYCCHDIAAATTQAKFRHFDRIDSARYAELWQLKQEEATELTQQLLAADRVISEQQLGWAWAPPDELLFVSPHQMGTYKQSNKRSNPSPSRLPEAGEEGMASTSGSSAAEAEQQQQQEEEGAEGEVSQSGSGSQEGTSRGVPKTLNGAAEVRTRGAGAAGLP